MRSYGAARTFFSILSFISWIVIIGGAIYFLSALSALNDINRGRFGIGNLAAAGLIDGPWIMFIGFLGLVGDQIGRAAVDTAEYAQQHLKVARDQLEISKQALRQGSAIEKGYAALKAADTEMSGKGFASDHEGAKIKSSFANSPKTTATVPPADIGPLVVPDHKPGDLIEYRTKLIRVEEGGYLFASRLHESLEDALARVNTNTHLPNRRADEPKVVTDRYAAVTQSGGEAARIEPPLRAPSTEASPTQSFDTRPSEAPQDSPSLDGQNRK